MKKSHQGFSLVELMIAVVLGLILMTGVIQMFVSSKAAFSSQQAISRVQETGRLAIEFLARDLRMAGFLGCASNTASNLSHLKNPSDFANNWLESIRGYSVTDAAGTGAPVGAGLSPVPLNGTDLFVVRAAAVSGITTSADNVNTKLFVALPSVTACSSGTGFNGLCVGDVVVESDCTSATVFQVTGLSNVAGSLEIQHTGVASVVPGNQVTTWGGVAAVAPDHNYLAGAEVFKLSRIVYFIGLGTSNRPSLYQNVDGVNTELLEGVEDMRITYGIASSTATDAPPDQYLTATAVNASSSWDKVLSMRVQLLIQSAEDKVMPESQTYTFAGTQTTAPDRRLRQVFVSTVGIRSRLP